MLLLGSSNPHHPLVPHRMSRKPAHLQDDTLANLRLHAFELFGRFGFEGVSVGDIAKRAKLSKGALYWHFDGKEALYLDCLKRLHLIFKEDVFDPMTAAPSGLNGIVGMFQGLMQLFADPRISGGISGFWIIPNTPETLQFTAAQRQFEADSRRVIEATLRRAIAEGHMDLADELEDFSRALISLIEACLLPMRHLSTEELRSQLGVLARTMLRAYAKDPAVVRMADNI